MNKKELLIKIYNGEITEKDVIIEHDEEEPECDSYIQNDGFDYWYYDGDGVISLNFITKDKYTENEPYEFFVNSRDCACMNKQTAEDISKLLLYLKENGEKKALAYYKSLYKIHKNDREFTL